MALKVRSNSCVSRWSIKLIKSVPLTAGISNAVKQHAKGRNQWAITVWQLLASSLNIPSLVVLDVCIRSTSQYANDEIHWVRPYSEDVITSSYDLLRDRLRRATSKLKVALFVHIFWMLKRPYRWKRTILINEPTDISDCRAGSWSLLKLNPLTSTSWLLCACAVGT